MSLMPNAATSAVGGEEEDEDEITPEQMADLMEHFGIRDDASIAASALRFSIGNLVIYKPRGMMFGVLHAENTVGWYEGEVVKVSQRMIYSEDRCGEYIAYIMWPRRDLPDDELGTERVLEDTDEFIRQRPADLTPDPAKFKPLFVAPDDPYYYLYTDTKHFDSTTEEDEEIENMYRRMGVDDAKTKPDGSVMLSHGGKRLTTSIVIVEIPWEPILGVDPYTAMMFSSHYLSVRERTVYTKTLPDMIETFKAVNVDGSVSI